MSKEAERLYGDLEPGLYWFEFMGSRLVDQECNTGIVMVGRHGEGPEGKDVWFMMVEGNGRRRLSEDWDAIKSVTPIDAGRLGEFYPFDRFNDYEQVVSDRDAALAECERLRDRRRCICDEPGETICSIHHRENQLQDERTKLILEVEACSTEIRTQDKLLADLKGEVLREQAERKRLETDNARMKEELDGCACGDPFASNEADVSTLERELERARQGEQAWQDKAGQRQQENVALSLAVDGMLSAAAMAKIIVDR